MKQLKTQANTVPFKLKTGLAAGTKPMKGPKDGVDPDSPQGISFDNE